MKIHAGDTCSALRRICIPGSNETFLSMQRLYMRQSAVVPPGAAQLCYTITFLEQGKERAFAIVFNHTHN